MSLSVLFILICLSSFSCILHNHFSNNLLLPGLLSLKFNVRFSLTWQLSSLICLHNRIIAHKKFVFISKSFPLVAPVLLRIKFVLRLIFLAWRLLPAALVALNWFFSFVEMTGQTVNFLFEIRLVMLMQKACCIVNFLLMILFENNITWDWVYFVDPFHLKLWLKQSCVHLELNLFHWVFLMVAHSILF